MYRVTSPSSDSWGPRLQPLPLLALLHNLVGLDDEHGGAGGLRLLENVTSPSVQYAVDSSNCVLRALDFNKVDRLHQPGIGCQHGGVEHSPGGGNDLTTAPVDRVRVQGHVVDVEPNSSQVFVTHHTLLGGPLEASNNTVLDLVQVLNSL